MLWRAAYNTWEGAAASMPTIEGKTLHGEHFQLDERCVILGGFDLRSSAELGVWKRLLLSLDHCPPCWTLYLLPNPGPTEQAKLSAMTPRSQWQSTVIALLDESWTNLIQVDRPGRSFAAVKVGSILDPLMVGIPTEEAWDRFQQGL